MSCFGVIHLKKKKKMPAPAQLEFPVFHALVSVSFLFLKSRFPESDFPFVLSTLVLWMD
jgi:hypothetical protein